MIYSNPFPPLFSRLLLTRLVPTTFEAETRLGIPHQLLTFHVEFRDLHASEHSIQRSHLSVTQAEARVRVEALSSAR